MLFFREMVFKAGLTVTVTVVTRHHTIPIPIHAATPPMITTASRYNTNPTTAHVTWDSPDVVDVSYYAGETFEKV